jgi:hypothetical protein
MLHHKPSAKERSLPTIFRHHMLYFHAQRSTPHLLASVDIEFFTLAGIYYVRFSTERSAHSATSACRQLWRSRFPMELSSWVHRLLCEHNKGLIIQQH